MRKSDVKERLKNCSLSELTAMISKSPSIIYSNRNEIDTRLYQLKLHITQKDADSCTLSDVGEFALTAIRVGFSKDTFDTLKKFIPRILEIGKWDGFANGLSAREKLIIMLLFDKESLINMKFSTDVLTGEDRSEVLSMFYSVLINMHLTTLFPSSVIQFFLDLNFEEILSSEDTKLINDSFSQEESTRLVLKDLILIFKAIHDIYNNEESCYQFLSYWRTKVMTVDSFETDVDTLSNRYGKYLTPDDAEDNSFIMYLTQTLGGDNTQNVPTSIFDEECDNFLNDCDAYADLIPNDVLRCLIGDCTQMLQKHSYLNPNWDRVNYVSNRLMKKWNKTEEVAFDFPQQGYRNNPIEALDQMIAKEDDSSISSAVDTLIFDFGSVLLYSSAFKHLSGLQKRIPKDKFEVVAKCLYTYMHEHSAEDDEQKLLEGFKNALHPSLREYAEDIMKPLLTSREVFDYSLPLIKSLKSKGYKLYYLSNASKLSYKLQTNRDVLNLIKLFDGGIFSFEVECEKPDKKIFTLLLEKYNIEPGKAMFFDDRQENIDAANSLGIQGVLWKRGSHEEVTKLPKVLSSATEATHKDSIAMNAAGKKIYKAYRTYKESEEKVDSQITKALVGLKNVTTGDVRTEIIEGKKFSAIGLLKKLLGTVALFSFGKIKAVIFLVVRYALKKKTTQSERRKIILELETEIEMITEKIEDARGDGNREAKYSMMRTKKELENAKKRIEYGLEASQRDVTGAKAVLNEARSLAGGEPR